MISFEKVKRRFPEARVVPGKNGLEFYVHCPEFHRKGGYYKMNINSETGVYFCQDCHATGNAEFEWFDEIEDAFDHLAVERDAELSTIMNVRANSRSGVFLRRGGEMLENNVLSPGRLISFASLEDEHPAVDYLARRGYDIDEIRNLEPNMALQYCARGISFRCGTTTGRLVFPIYMDHVLKGWQARKIERVQGDIKEVWNNDEWVTVQWNSNKEDWADRDVPKYLTCPGMPRGNVLYGYDQARRERSSDNQLVVVVEGPLDQLRVGYPCVGSLGGLSNTQLRLIQTYWETAVILRDPNIDPESRSFRDILSSLSAIQVCHLNLPGGKDPGDTPRNVTWKEIAREMSRRNYEVPLHCQRN